jgi:hypothetical protein
MAYTDSPRVASYTQKYPVRAFGSHSDGPAAHSRGLVQAAILGCRATL